MRCRSVLTRVDAHRTGELVVEERQRLESHLETCPSCRESRGDVDDLAVAIKALVVAPPRSCRDEVCESLRDTFGSVRVGDRVVRVAFTSEGARMVDASGDPVAIFRREYGRRFGRELIEGIVPDEIRRAVEKALRGETTGRVDIDLSGVSAFERSVLEALRSIPRGEVRSYDWIASRVGRPRAARAVGNALARNPVPLLLPCHRVLPSTGRLGRYVFGADMKRSLLESEGVPLADLERLGGSGVRFIGSATTKIFCVPACRDARRIRERNRVPFRSATEAVDKGYRACRHCVPVPGDA